MKKTNINRKKKTEKRSFLHFFVFVKFDQKTKKKTTRIENKNEKKNNRRKKRKNENKPNIKRKKKEHQVFFATISGFRSFAYIIRRNLTIFSSSRKGPQQLWRLALLHVRGSGRP